MRVKLYLKTIQAYKFFFFNIRIEMWKSYLEWPWCYFSANDIKDHGRIYPYADCTWAIRMPAPQKPPTVLVKKLAMN